ncbi:phosphatase PAP2 family protein [Candidatus Berkiella aquae]|uniref:undecaprenyl-diphosphate phosphatase n=1 Tax=Candidatus Berkiella aquae TaxID=295108 RepID=A0A0Q9YUJ1_9GAMM|nr:phosphatase PAP2 family protein [Candidatus Berkiella aquae]MCS5710840.1 phosphatase PAP2 family protein [Candidatus Berkiella aquae]
MKISFRKQSLIPFIILLSMARPSQASGIDDVGSESFLIAISIPLIGGIYSYTSGDIEGLKELTMSCAVTAQVTALLKNTVHRTRPNREDDLSFPSGHAAASFAGASYLHHRYGLNWGLPFYAIGTAISIQRVNVKAHYWTDVLAGAAIGYLSSYLFTVRYPNVWINPDFNPERNSYGMQMHMSFD